VQGGPERGGVQARRVRCHRPVSVGRAVAVVVATVLRAVRAVVAVMTAVSGKMEVVHAGSLVMGGAWSRL
jgi:hypothetical protein